MFWIILIVICLIVSGLLFIFNHVNNDLGWLFIWAVISIIVLLFGFHITDIETMYRYKKYSNQLENNIYVDDVYTCLVNHELKKMQYRKLQYPFFTLVPDSVMTMEPLWCKWNSFSEMIDEAYGLTGED